MKYYTFYRENNNFTDILSDINIKKVKSAMTDTEREIKFLEQGGVSVTRYPIQN